MLGLDMNLVEKGIRGTFAREFITRQRKAKYTRFCTVVNSDKQTEVYNAISTLPQLAETTDERILAGFSEYSYSLQNKVYMTGIKVPRTMFEFDQTGQLRTLVQSLGSRVANFPDKLIMTVIGDNGTGYDSVAHFSASHDLGDGVSQTNLVAGGQTNTTMTGTTKANRDDSIASFQLDLIDAKGVLSEINDDRGEPWHDDAEPEGLIILCHPRNEFFCRTALEAAIVSDTSNLTVKSVGGIITTNYSAPFKDSGGTVRYGTWYLLKIDSPVHPFLFQRFAPKVDFPDTIPEADHSALQALNAVEVQTIMRVGQNVDSQTFFNDEFLFGARTLYSAGYGVWQNVIQVRASDYA